MKMNLETKKKINLTFVHFDWINLIVQSVINKINLQDLNLSFPQWDSYHHPGSLYFIIVLFHKCDIMHYWEKQNKLFTVREASVGDSPFEA